MAVDEETGKPMMEGNRENEKTRSRKGRPLASIAAAGYG
jgi:hypothetical protein